MNIKSNILMRTVNIIITGKNRICRWVSIPFSDLDYYQNIKSSSDQSNDGPFFYLNKPKYMLGKTHDLSTFGKSSLMNLTEINYFK